MPHLVKKTDRGKEINHDYSECVEMSIEIHFVKAIGEW